MFYLWSSHSTFESGTECEKNNKLYDVRCLIFAHWDSQVEGNDVFQC